MRSFETEYHALILFHLSKKKFTEISFYHTFRIDYFKKRPNILIDTKASNNGYRWKMPYAYLLTHSDIPNLEMLLYQKTLSD